MFEYIIPVHNENFYKYFIWKFDKAKNRLLFISDDFEKYLENINCGVCMMYDKPRITGVILVFDDLLIFKLTYGVE